MKGRDYPGLLPAVGFDLVSTEYEELVLLMMVAVAELVGLLLLELLVLLPVSQTYNHIDESLT